MKVVNLLGPREEVASQRAMCWFHRFEGGLKRLRVSEGVRRILGHYSWEFCAQGGIKMTSRTDFAYIWTRFSSSQNKKHFFEGRWFS